MEEFCDEVMSKWVRGSTGEESKTDHGEATIMLLMLSSGSAISQ